MPLSLTWSHLWDPRRRTNRLQYLTIFIVSVVLAVVSTELSPENEILALLIYGAVTVVNTVRRCHDIGRRWHWGLLLLIPMVNIWFHLYLFFKQGEESNEWGNKGSSAGEPIVEDGW